MMRFEAAVRTPKDVWLDDAADVGFFCADLTTGDRLQ